ncbi:MAG: hypothetical protein KAR11_07640, partial [Phycisphaerae bacterium]|nr:hypothetical protein [Phycisphaerae bacterium]
MGAQNPQQLVCVDARTVYSPNPRGTGKNLVDLYARVAQRRKDLRFVMLHRNGSVSDPFAKIPNVENMCVDIPGDRWNFWENIRLPLTARRLKASLLHCPANTAPKFGKTPLLVTIHD